MHITNLILPLFLTNLALAGPIEERATLVECNSEQKQMLQAAVTHAGQMAQTAAASIKANNATSLFQGFFKTTDSASMNHVANILEEISDEASNQGGGLVSYSCQPDGMQCAQGSFTQTGYAETDGFRGDVRTCPAYFQLPQVSDDCATLDQRTSSLHELSHTKGVLGFEVYGHDAVLKLDTQTALKNAESYAFFSKSVYLGCDASASSSGLGSWFPW